MLSKREKISEWFLTKPSETVKGVYWRFIEVVDEEDDSVLGFIKYIHITTDFDFDDKETIQKMKAVSPSMHDFFVSAKKIQELFNKNGVIIEEMEIFEPNQGEGIGTALLKDTIRFLKEEEHIRFIWLQATPFVDEIEKYQGKMKKIKIAQFKNKLQRFYQRKLGLKHVKDKNKKDYVNIPEYMYTIVLQ